MNFKKLLPLLFLVTLSIFTLAQETAKVKIYGFVRNDFFYNSRQNVESIDGVFHLFPKPILLNATNADINGTPQAEMLSIATRLGLDITGSDVLGAKSVAKIEADFAGFGTSNTVLRIRQAHIRLNWKTAELLVGQTWHPLFGSVMPTGTSLNAGAPFQPFNRSPQVRFKQNISMSLSLMVAASYQMQYLSQGPIGSSATYLKNGLLPDLFVGIESKTKQWTSGIGIEAKKIKPTVEQLISGSIVAYTQFIDTKFQFKAKSLLGQNLSDYIMPCGYGVSDSINSNVGYTNFNMSSSWLNLVYGKKWQAGLFVGYIQNLGSTKKLVASGGKFIAYGYGVNDQLLIDRVYRIAPHVSFNLPNLKFGLEYDFTEAKYGTLKNDGRVSNPYSVNNHRIVSSVSYFF